MGLRPGPCYSSTKDRAYTRLAVKVHRKNYVGAAPGLKTRQFNMGNPLKEFSHILDLVAKEKVQVRDNAIESSRIAINRFLHNNFGKDGYFMKIRVYPHQLLRENKQAQGAGADRISTGMSHSFGKVIGRAVRVRPGQKMMSVLVDEANIEAAKTALLRANARMPLGLDVVVHTDVKSIGSKPRKIKVTKAETKEEEEKAGGAEEAKGEKKKSGEEAKAGEKKAEPKAEGRQGEKK